MSCSYKHTCRFCGKSVANSAAHLQKNASCIQIRWKIEEQKKQDIKNYWIIKEKEIEEEAKTLEPNRFNTLLERLDELEKIVNIQKARIDDQQKWIINHQIKNIKI